MRRFILVATSFLCLVGAAFAQTGDTVPGTVSSQRPVEEIPGAGDGVIEPGSSDTAKSESPPPSFAIPEEPGADVPASSSVAIIRSAMPTSEVASSRAVSSEQVASRAISSVAPSSKAAQPRPRKYSSSSSSIISSSSQSSSAMSSAETASGFVALLHRENFGYSVPFINPDILASPQTFSWGAVPVNMLLAFLFSIVMGLSGLLLFSVGGTHARTGSSWSRTLSVSTINTILLIELYELLVPSVSAQGFDAQASVSFLRLPSYAFLFFVVTGITDSFYGSLRSMPIKTLDRWLKKMIGREESQRAWWFLIVLILLYAVVSSYRNLQFNLIPSAQLGIIVVTIVSLLIKTYSTDAFKLFVARRWKHPSWFEANVGGLVFAIACVYITRKFQLNPGFLYGLPVGLYLLLKDSHRNGLFHSLSAWWELVLAAIIWFIAPLLQPYEVLYDVFIAIPFILIEGLFFDLIPIPSMSGGTIFQWKKILWAIQFVIVTFLLFQFIFNPDESVGSIQQSPPTMFMLIGLACYIVGVVCLWLYVKMRRAKN